MSATSLPAGFQDLEPFVAYWALDTSEERRRARSEARMAEIQRFYDAVVAHAEDGMAYLERFPLGEMPADAERLFKLLLAMNHAAIAVEMHGQPRAIDSVWPSAVHITQGAWPLGGRL